MMQIRDWPALAAVIVVLAVLVAGMVIGARCAGSGENPGNGRPDIGTIATPTSQSGKPAPQPGVKTIIQGTGVWIAPEPVAEGDSIPVQVEIVQHGESVGVNVWVDSVPVVWQELRLTWPRERFGAFGEAAWVGDRFRPAAGIAWKPAVLLGVEVGPAVAVGLDRPAWGAVEARLSRRVYSTIEAGIGVGYRVGDCAGLHIGVGAGFAF